MKLSDYVIEFLILENITHIFEICGGAVTHLLDSLYERKDISAVSLHHEQAASFAAEGYSRASQNIGVAMATSGPGATNLITGIASSFFDSIPCLFITGQVNTYEFKFDRSVRQVGFQETDIVNIVKPIIKKSTLVTDPNKIRYFLEESVYLARSGRPGPVLIDIPMNIQRADIKPELLESFYNNKSNEQVDKGLDEAVIKKIAESIASAFRPVVFIGAGVRLSKACDELSEFIRKTRIPVVTSLMGLDAFPHNNNSFAGMIGTYGNRYANLTVANADLILALGVRFDTRQTGTKPETFARGAKIIHVDIDPSELNNKVRADLPIKSDVKKFLTALNNFKINYPQKHREPWREKIRLYKQRYPSYKPSMDDAINPNFFMHELSMFIPEDAVICVDVGQHQMWAAQSLELKATHRFLTQGGMGAMGSALSMSIGASFAKPKRIIVVITGDGGFQLNIQELQTIHHYQLPIKIILLNNGCYGMVRQFQEQYFHCRFQSTVIGYSCPNFQEVVSAYKISVMRATFTKECAGLFQKLFDNSKPTLLEVSIKQDTQVLPKLSVNKPVEDQDPPMSRGELKSNMFIDIFQEDKKNED